MLCFFIQAGRPVSTDTLSPLPFSSSSFSLDAQTHGRQARSPRARTHATARQNSFTPRPPPLWPPCTWCQRARTRPRGTPWTGCLCTPAPLSPRRGGPRAAACTRPGRRRRGRLLCVGVGGCGRVFFEGVRFLLGRGWGWRRASRTLVLARRLFIFFFPTAKTSGNSLRLRHHPLLQAGGPAHAGVAA